MRFVARWAESNKWHDVATCPVLVDKLKALADEIERQQTAATEKAKVKLRNFIPTDRELPPTNLYVLPIAVGPDKDLNV